MMFVIVQSEDYEDFLPVAVAPSLDEAKAEAERIIEQGSLDWMDTHGSAVYAPYRVGGYTATVYVFPVRVVG